MWMAAVGDFGQSLSIDTIRRRDLSSSGQLVASAVPPSAATTPLQRVNLGTKGWDGLRALGPGPKIGWSRRYAADL